MSSEILERTWKNLKDYNFSMENERFFYLLCPICHKIMIKACHTNCGCRFCYDCLVEYLNENNNFCPGNKPGCLQNMIDIDSNIQIDYPINVQISEILVKCPLETCVFEDKLNKIGYHIRMCDKIPLSCPYSNVGCANDKLAQEHMNDHLISENYNHTTQLIDEINNLRNDIEILKRDNIEIHHKNNGYQVEIERLTLDGQMNGTAIAQLNTTVTTLQTANNLLNNQLATMKNIGDRNSRSISSLEVLVNSNKRKISDGKDKVDKLTKEKQTMSEQMYSMKIINKEILKSLSGNSCTMSLFETKLLDYNGKLSHVQRNYDQKYGQFDWIIDNFSQKFKNARDKIQPAIFSTPFLSHPNGYKMCLILFPNGKGTGKDSHLSIYFCIMRGPFDDNLTWPYKYDVTLSIVDKSDIQLKMLGVVRYNNLLNEAAYTRPISTRNIGTGFQKFIELEEILINRSLFLDDELIIRCCVNVVP